jgi:hypothetical protein
VVSEHSWQPRSLIDIAAEPPEPPTIGGLLYPGKRILLSGETESCKTWLALILSKAEMDVGLAVAWADLDAMGAGELLSRLRTLDVPDETIARRFLYYEPTEALKAGRLDDVCALLRERAVRLFVIDAFNPILNLHGLDPNKTTEVETFWREVADPIAQTGAAPTLLDHVAKGADRSSKYAYGSERKASGAIVHIGFRTIEAFKRGGTGRTLLATHKDRPGFLPRPTIGRLVLVSDGERITYELEPDRSREGDKFRPTFLMERISRTLEMHTEAVSKNWVEKNVEGKTDAKRTALDCLIDEGYVARDETNRGSQLTSARPYREADDPVLKWADENADETSPQPRPNLAPDLTSVIPDPTSPPRPPRKRGEGENRSATSPPFAGATSPSSMPTWSDGDGAPPLSDDLVEDLTALAAGREQEMWQ